MQIVGVVPEDAPDPRIEAQAELRKFPVPAVTFVPQATIEELGFPGVERGGDGAGMRDMSVSFSYTLIRNPADRSSPENLADLDEGTRQALDEVPPWPRPPWLIEFTERLRYPQLWEAVRTSWSRPDAEASLDDALLQHINHVLRNQFRVERGLEGHAGGVAPAPDVTAASIQRDALMIVDAAAYTGIRIDTDPHVYAIAARLGEGRLVTVVVPRDELHHIELELQSYAME